MLYWLCNLVESVMPCIDIRIMGAVAFLFSMAVLMAVLYLMVQAVLWVLSFALLAIPYLLIGYVLYVVIWTYRR